MSKQSNNKQRRHATWQMRVRIVCLLVAWLAVPTVQAQLGLPRLTLPDTRNLPTPQLPTTKGIAQPLDTLVSGATNELDSQSQRLLRVARTRELLRANPDTLEADANGAPVLRGQVIALSPTAQSLQIAVTAGFIIIQDQSMDELGLRMVTLQTPPGMTAQRALLRLRKLDHDGNYDYNHLYTQSSVAAQNIVATVAADSASNDVVASYPNTRIGLIDGGVDANHPVFHSNRVHSWGCNQHLPSAHGTAVASLLVGQSERFNGAAPGAALYAADVYCGQPVGGAMTRIANALAWLAQQRVPVINISLVGPDNALLKQLVANLIARGYLIVAAVGNDGPAAPPLYPASYPDVIGVTAVDAHDRVLVEAGRGKQVTFAAPGADMAAATLDGKFAGVRGTSFAAPLVAGLLAMHIDEPQPAAANVARTLLINSARGMGSARPDKIYGYGVVGAALRVPLLRVAEVPEK